LPEAVAYAGIANLPPQAGVIGLAVGLICYGALGSSRFALVAATSSSAAVLAASIHSLQPSDALQALVLSAGLVMIAGACFVVAGCLRLGHIANFISKPVLRGFVFGLSIVIAVKQFAVMIAIQPHHTGVIPVLIDLVGNWRDWNVVGLVVGGATLALVCTLTLAPKIPGPLIAICAGIAATPMFDLQAHGVALVGTMHLSLESVSFPELASDDWRRLSELAVALMLVLFAESYGSIRTLALRHGDQVSLNRDLVALGVANLLSGLLRGTPVGAGYSATSANEAAGARSKISGLVAATTVIVLVALFLPQIAAIPQPVLAAIVIYAIRHSLGFAALRPYVVWKRDRFVVVVAVLAVILLGVLDGLLAAIATSLIMMLRKLAQPRLSELGRLGSGHDFVKMTSVPGVQRVPGILILRPEAPLFFANAEHVFAAALVRLDSDTAAHTLVLSLEETPDLDGTSIEALRDFDAQIRQRGRRLLLARIKEGVQDALSRASLADLQTQRSRGFSVDDVVSEAITSSSQKRS
jgi:MFS superfamily sulfate permease-like transporter